MSDVPGQRWGNRPAQLVDSWRFLGAALQVDGETRSVVVTASSIRRRSAAWTILLDWTYRSRRPASASWMTRAESVREVKIARRLDEGYGTENSNTTEPGLKRGKNVWF